MKIILLLFSLFAAGAVRAQITFTQKASFPGGTRWKLMGQALGTKVYYGLGQDSAGAMYKDLWCYETTTNTWTQKADMPIAVRRNLTACAIAGKLYAGFGYDGASRKDWWMYDDATNTWTQKASFPGAARYWASMFEWNGKGFLVGGEGYNGSYTDYKDVWEYDPATDAWTQKPDMPGAARCHALCQRAGATVLYGLGQAANTNWYSDIFKYNCTTGAWTSVPALPAAIGLAVADGNVWWSAAHDKKIVVMNIQAEPTIDSALKHIYVYDTAANTWAVYPFANKSGYRFAGAGGQVGTKAYVGLGYDPTPDVWFRDMWEVNLAGLVTGIEQQYPALADVKVFAALRKIHTVVPDEVWKRGPVIVELFSMDGRKLLSQTLRAGETVDASALPSASYTWLLRLSGQHAKSGIVMLQ